MNNAAHLCLAYFAIAGDPRLAISTDGEPAQDVLVLLIFRKLLTRAGPWPRA